MEQIIPDNENIEDYFTGDEIDEWEDLDEWEFETLEELRDALNRWVDNIYEKGVPEKCKQDTDSWITSAVDYVY